MKFTKDNVIYKPQNTIRVKYSDLLQWKLFINVNLCEISEGKRLVNKQIVFSVIHYLGKYLEGNRKMQYHCPTQAN